MLAKFKIGSTPGTLTDIIAANIIAPQREYEDNYNNLINTNRTQDNSLYVRITGKEKREIGFTFQNLEKAKMITLKAYCNIPQFFWVQIENSTSSEIYIEGYFFLSLGKVNVIALGEDFIHGFSLTLMEK